MGLSASQGRLLMLTARRSDLEFRAQQIAHNRILLSQELEGIAKDYERATTNKKLTIRVMNGSTAEDVNLTYDNLKQAYKDKGQKFRIKDSHGRNVLSSTSELPVVPTTKGAKSNVNQSTYKATNANGDSTALGGVLGSSNKASVACYDNKPIYKVDGKYYSAMTGEEINESSSPKISDVSGLKFEETYVRGLKNDSNVGYISAGSEYNGNSAGNVFSVNTDSSIKLKEGTNNVYELKDMNGNTVEEFVVMPAIKEKQTDGSDINAFQTMLTMGIVHIEVEKKDSNGDVIMGEYEAINYEDITDSESYTDDDNAAEIKYKRAQQEIQTKDKKLELELNQIETQRNAVTTEIDSVKKVISDNIEKTFKYFS